MGTGVAPVRFDGKDLYRPGYYGKRNVSGLDVAAASGSRLLLIGECKGGIPFNASTQYPNAEDRINWVSNTNEINSILRDGAAYYGALFALNPSAQAGVNGAPYVGVIRVNKATRSSLTIQDVDTDDVLDVYSKDYGLYTNQIRFQVSAGTTKGKKISVKFETTTVEKDDITEEVLSVQYTGTGSACAMTLDPAGNLVMTTTGGAAGDDVTIDLTTYTTAAELVAYLNAYQNTGGTNVYSATLLGDGSFLTSQLDKIVAGDSVDVKTSYTIKAILQACLDWFNNSSEYLTAELTSGGERRVPANMTGYEYITGGAEGATPVTQDYTDAMSQVTALTDASFVGVMTGEAAVHAALSTHLQEMSASTGRNERQGCVGPADGQTKAQKIAAAAALNDSLAGFFGTEIKRYDKNGDLQTWDGFYGACEIMGMSAGNAINFAPTNKMINAVAVKEVLSNSDIDDYIKGGVMIAQPSPLGGIRVVRSVTTYQASNIILNEWSAMRTALYITKDHRTYVEALIGEPGDNTVLESLKNRAQLRLEYYVDQGWFVVDPDLGNAYRNFQFVVEGDVVKISYEGTLVVPVNFILVTHNFTVVGFKK